MQAQAIRPALLITEPRTVDELSSFVAAAAESCRCRGLNMTPIRRRVLEVVAASPVPLAAYAIIHRLSDTKLLGPPTVYRALEFLVEAGFVRHLALRKAFVLCARPGEPFVAVLTCTDCGDTSEVTSEEVRAAMVRFASATGFAPHGRAIEIEGRCATCTRAAADHVP
ncbi:transcriptional repressor [Methylobacterium sp. WL64]|uniref:Fur family transcriptional regulator n=1 Tax=Methylobacterium sp. WL64 TaxID=2603894 RepID=UPI0011CC01D6|nr:Fur family transcriptional regulator [Methylobacterium sp. WL64]TXN00401.1 transcriptional repressor [Methylobacterium sp. WL64]